MIDPAKSILANSSTAVPESARFEGSKITTEVASSITARSWLPARSSERLLRPLALSDVVPDVNAAEDLALLLLSAHGDLTRKPRPNSRPPIQPLDSANGMIYSVSHYASIGGAV